MSLENIFYLKMLCVFLSAGIIFRYMQRIDKKRQQEAEEKFQRTIQIIDMKYKNGDNS